MLLLEFILLLSNKDLITFMLNWTIAPCFEKNMNKIIFLIKIMFSTNNIKWLKETRCLLLKSVSLDVNKRIKELYSIYLFFCLLLIEFKSFLF